MIIMEFHHHGYRSNFWGCWDCLEPMIKGGYHVISNGQSPSTDDFKRVVITNSKLMRVFHKIVGLGFPLMVRTGNLIWKCKILKAFLFSLIAWNHSQHPKEDGLSLLVNNNIFMQIRFCLVLLVTEKMMHLPLGWIKLELGKAVFQFKKKRKKNVCILDRCNVVFDVT